MRATLLINADMRGILSEILQIRPNESWVFQKHQSMLPYQRQGYQSGLLNDLSDLATVEGESSIALNPRGSIYFQVGDTA
jgi:hypothetical protein